VGAKWFMVTDTQTDTHTVRLSHRQTDSQTDGLTGRRTHRQADSQTDGQRHTDSQTDGHTNRNDEAKSLFSQFATTPKHNQIWLNLLALCRIETFNKHQLIKLNVHALE